MDKVAEIIKYEGDNSTFIWKHPCEDFNTLSQLIVHESQEAIFFMNGQALDLFGPGRYTLETQNIPEIEKTLKRATNGETPFHCEVYFINKTVQMAIKWGTPDRVRFIEPTQQIPFEIGASGELNLAVSDSRKLLVKLVGTMNGIAWGDRGNGFTKSIQDSFRTLIITAIKSNLSSCIKAKNIDILEIDEHLEELSDVIRQKILPGFEEYGLTIPQFYISNVALPDNDPIFKRFKEMHTYSFYSNLTKADEQRKIDEEDAKHKTAMLQMKHAAERASGEREIILEKETTETEIAKRKAEREMLEVQLKAQQVRMTGLAEAEVMNAKGYTQKDIIDADVKKEYAKSLGNMDFSSSGSGAIGDVVGIGVGLAAAGTIAPQIGNIFKDINDTQNQTVSSTVQRKCSNCGTLLPGDARFCASCGQEYICLGENEIICSHCGKKIPKGKFCIACGKSLTNNCPHCGLELPNEAKFCFGCGKEI